MAGPLDDKAVKSLLKKGKEFAEKLDEFFAVVFTAEDVGQEGNPRN